jgi:hypothetical protein
MNAVAEALPDTIMRWPLNATERMALCRDLATARLVPPAFQKSPADIFLAMNTIERLKLDFFMTIGECYVIQNRLGFSGKLAQAILNSSGRLAEKINHAYDGEGDDRTITTSGRIQGESAPRIVTVRLGDVKTKNTVWTSQPDQQLGYFAARTWGRRHLPEVLLGMQFDDEVQDMIDVTPNPPKVTDNYRETLRQRNEKPEQAPAAVAVMPLATTHDAAPASVESIAKGDRFYRERQNTETAAPVEVEPYELDIEERNSEDEWKRWGNDLYAYIKAARTFERVDEWIIANSDGFEALKHYDVGKFNRLRHMIQAAQDSKPKAATDDAG